MHCQRPSRRAVLTGSAACGPSVDCAIWPLKFRSRIPHAVDVMAKMNICVEFKCKILDNASPRQIAWNKYDRHIFCVLMKPMNVLVDFIFGPAQKFSNNQLSYFGSLAVGRRKSPGVAGLDRDPSTVQ